MADEFARALRLMRRRDPQLAEDGFQRLRGLAAEHVDRLIDEFRHETDRGARCLLLELIGEARSARAVDLLVGQLRSDDESLRHWAESGLRLLDTNEARTALAARPDGDAVITGQSRSNPNHRAAHSD